MAVARGHAAMSFSFASGSASRNVCIGVLPKHQHCDFAIYQKLLDEEERTRRVLAQRLQRVHQIIVRGD